MNKRLQLAACAATCSALILLAACGREESSTPAAPSKIRGGAVIRIDGSSTVFPIAEAVAEEFQSAMRGAVRVTVGVSGTGGGFKKLCRGDVEISNASRPILAEEMQACSAAGIKFMELPVAFDAITVVVHPENDWAKTLTVADLKKIWEPEAQGKITRWNQVRREWPDAPLMLFGPGADSGTFDYFTEAITGKAKASRGDYTASEDDNVLVQGVQHNKNALGYFGLAYYLSHKDAVRAVPIQADAAAAAVEPSAATVRDATYQPLSRPLFIYVNEAAAQRPEVRQFVEFYLTEGPALAGQVGFVPLPDDAAQLALEHFRAGRVGTVFGGVPEVGITIQELLEREAKL
jgi:phosphate transport system substrate-binding protein